jgi:hypothetical protein
MGPEDRSKLLSPDPTQRAEQERSEVYAKTARLIAESEALRKRAKELQDAADELIAAFKRNHPEL